MNKHKGVRISPLGSESKVHRTESFDRRDGMQSVRPHTVMSVYPWTPQCTD